MKPLTCPYCGETPDPDELTHGRCPHCNTLVRHEQRHRATDPLPPDDAAGTGHVADAVVLATPTPDSSVPAEGDAGNDDAA